MNQDRHPWRLKDMTPGDVGRRLLERPTLIVPVGTTEQHGPHLPLGCDTIIVERLAEDFDLTPSVLARYRPGHSRRLPEGSPGSVGYPSLASAQKGERLYRFILDRVTSCLTKS